MNVLKLVAPSPVVDETVPKERSAVDKGKPPEKPWLVSLRNLSVDNYTIQSRRPNNFRTCHPHCKKPEDKGGEYLDRQE